MRLSALSHDLEVCGILAEEEGVGEPDFGNGTDGDNVGRLFEIHRDFDSSLCRIGKEPTRIHSVPSLT